MKIVVILVVVLVLAAGTVGGLAFTGTLKIPGVTPKHLMQAKKVAPKVEVKPKPASKPVAKKEPEEDRQRPKKFTVTTHGWFLIGREGVDR